MLMKRLKRICSLWLLVLLPVLCSCSAADTSPAEQTTAASSGTSEETETVTSEEIYLQALDLLCYGDADYRRNKVAKELLEIIQGYKDSEKYLGEIYEVCTQISGERISSEFVYDEYGHVMLEKGNPYYYTEDQEAIPYAIQYEYTDGKITRELYPSGDDVMYTDDDRGRIAEMKIRYAGGNTFSYTYEYETDEEGKITKRTATSEGEPAGERTSRYIVDTDGMLSVLQHEEVLQRTPPGKDRLLSFNKKGQLVRVDNETNYSTYTYGYVWMPMHDPDEEFVYEHRIQVSYF